MVDIDKNFYDSERRLNDQSKTTFLVKTGESEVQKIDNRRNHILQVGYCRPLTLEIASKYPHK